MCGIAGGLSRKPDLSEIASVIGSMRHRGPDDNGSMSDGDCWLAAVRLSIQDLSHHGHQPMQSADGRYTLIFNGEIYNHWDIRKELIAKGAAFHSSSDTETLLAAYIEWDKDCLQRLKGIFAFAVWDAVDHTLFIARDAMGVKPLYYYWYGKEFYFASELKSFLTLPGFNNSIQPESFYNYLLLLYNPDAQTPFQHVKKLMPGHYLSLAYKQEPIPTKWYHPEFKEEGLWNERDWISLTETTLKNAVQSQLISDAPLGFFLSGGLDSSLLVAMAKQAGTNYECFTIDTGNGMREEGFEDDLPFAKKAAQHLGVSLTTIPYASQDLLSDLDGLIWHLDEPQTDPAALHVRRISQAAHKKGIKVLLSGTGADDIFSGYRRHQALHWQKRLQRIPSGLLNASFVAAGVLGNTSLKRRIEKVRSSGILSGNDLSSLFFWMNEDQVAALFQSGTAIGSAKPLYDNILHRGPSASTPLNQMLLIEQQTFLPHHNLNYLDKMTMAESVEGRVPYLDTDLVSLANSMPEQLKMKGSQTKYILRQVAEKYLPKEIIYRKKTGFGSPLRSWMRGHNLELAKERLLDKSFAQWNIFNPAAIEELVRDTSTGKRDGAYTLYSLLAIESWLRQFAANNTSHK